MLQMQESPPPSKLAAGFETVSIAQSSGPHLAVHAARLERTGRRRAILVEDGLLRAHAVVGPDFGEIEEALRWLEASGAVRAAGAGWVESGGG